MAMEVSTRQKTDTDPIYLHFQLYIKNTEDLHGDYSYIPDNCIVQTYLQIRNPDLEDEIYETAVI